MDKITGYSPPPVSGKREWAIIRTPLYQRKAGWLDKTYPIYRHYYN